ncbi:MAG: preprotein translocase subunit YajC [Planctomycetia bacterium]|nr:preprotein translocase subunit YajC [Planctomycetia bacterium]
MLLVLVMFAQGGDAAAPRTGLPLELLLLPVLLLLFYFIVIRPAQKRKEREESERLSSLQKDDEVLTIGGIYGSVVSVSSDKDKDEIVVKVSDNTRLRMTRAAIHRNLSHEERQKAKSAEKKDSKTSNPASSGQIRKA